MSHYSIDVVAIVEFPDGTAGQVGIALHDRLPDIIDQKYVLTAEEFNAARQRCASADLHIADWTALNKERHVRATAPENPLANGKPTARRKASWIFGFGVMTVKGKRGFVAFEGGAIDEAIPRFFEIGGGPVLLDGLRQGDFVALEVFGTKVHTEVMLSMTKKRTIVVDAAPVLLGLARTFDERLRGLT